MLNRIALAWCCWQDPWGMFGLLVVEGGQLLLCARHVSSRVSAKVPRRIMGTFLVRHASVLQRVWQKCVVTPPTISGTSLDVRQMVRRSASIRRIISDLLELVASLLLIPLES